MQSNFLVMAKPTAAIGNLDFKYRCVLSREALRPASWFCMTDDVKGAAGVDTVAELAMLEDMGNE